MKPRKSAISTLVPVIVVIIIVAVAGVAYYFASGPSSGKTSTSSSASQTTTASMTTPVTTTSSSAGSSTSSATTSASSAMTTTSSSIATTTSSGTTASTSSATTTSSTPSTTSHTTTSSAAATSSCSTASSTTASAGQQLVAYYSAYSTMSFSFQGSKNGASDNLSLTYNVVYHSATTFKVSFNVALNGQTTPSTVWIKNDGTVVAVYVMGTNLTGSVASGTVLGYFADLQVISNFAIQESSITAYFHSMGTSTAKVGTTSFTVTRYVANTTPETVQDCSGTTAVLTAYDVFLGTPSGSSIGLVTQAHFAGTLTDSSGTTTLDYAYQLTALTVA